jgi:hypothetical protein
LPTGLRSEESLSALQSFLHGSVHPWYLQSAILSGILMNAYLWTFFSLRAIWGSLSIIYSTLAIKVSFKGVEYFRVEAN